MKKSLKIICIGVIVAAVLAAVVYVIIKVINVQSSRFEKKDDSKLREEISHDTPDKDPDDIVIPDDITEEEKQKLQEEKEYWTAVKEAKKLIAEKVLSSALPDESVELPIYIQNFQSVRRINNFYVEGNNVVVDADILYNGYDESLQQMNFIFSFSNEAIELDSKDLSSVMNYITEENTKAKMISNLSAYDFTDSLDEFYQNHVKDKYLLKEYQKQGYLIELADIKCALSGKGEIPTIFLCISKLTKDDEIMYMAHELDTFMVANGNMDIEQWREFVKTTSNKNVFKSLEQKWTPTGFDWKALSEEYSG
ncbi:MAG: hypothetical protein ACI4MW_02345 [Christensenellales bacterium]